MVGIYIFYTFNIVLNIKFIVCLLNIQTENKIGKSLLLYCTYLYVIC